MQILVALVAGVMVFSAQMAAAAIFTVNTTADGSDSVPGDGLSSALLAAVLMAGSPSSDAVAPAVSFEILHSFATRPPSAPHGSVLVHANGRYYGTLIDSVATVGASGFGALYEYDPATGNVAILHRFNGLDGLAPYAPLITGPDGALYGTTRFGGANQRGTIFRWDVSTSSFTMVFSFSGQTGDSGAALLLASDGKLYGTGRTLFRFDLATSTMTVLHSFSAAEGTGQGALIQAADGSLYGTAGAFNGGVIYRYDISSSTYTAAHTFAGGAGGENPVAGLVSATDGRLYGTTSGGGTENRGTLFRYDPASAAFAVLYSFTAADGSRPYATLIERPGGLLFGTTVAGGSTGDHGTLFRYDIGAAAFTTVVRFDGPGGRRPVASLVDAGAAGLVGATVEGGLGLGTIYRFEPATGAVTTLHAFRGMGAAAPRTSLVRGNDGLFYGTTVQGGASGAGTLFRYDLGGSGFAELHAFDPWEATYPLTALVPTGVGELIGTMSRGGAHGEGTLFRYDIASSTATSLHSFGPLGFSRGPSGSIAVDGGILYGATRSPPGNGGWGKLYKYDRQTAVVTTVHVFQSVATDPAGGVIRATDGFLYGVTLEAEFSPERASLFRADVSTIPATVTFLRTFLLDVPFAGVVQALDGWLYGTTRNESSGSGVLFRYNPATAAFATLHTFPGFSFPTGPLIEGLDGALYGTTERGGANGLGMVFRFDPRGQGSRTSTAFTILHSFSGADGSGPVAGLLHGPDFALYGTTPAGGPNGGGVLFRLYPYPQATAAAPMSKR